MEDLRDRGAKIIIGDFYEEVARKVEDYNNKKVISFALIKLFVGDVSGFQVQNDPKRRLCLASSRMV